MGNMHGELNFSSAIDVTEVIYKRRQVKGVSFVQTTKISFKNLFHTLGEKPLRLSYHVLP